MIVEYPKALYLGNQDAEMRTVSDSDEELAARAEGFIDLSEPAFEAAGEGDTTPAKRGRPAKAQ